MLHRFMGQGITGKAALVAVLSLMTVSCLSAVAAVGPGSGIESELEQNYADYFGGAKGSTAAAEIVISIRSALVRVLSALLLLAALASLALSVYNMMGGEPSGAKRFLMWGIGLVVGFALMSVLSRMGTVAKAGEGFAGLQGTVAEVLEILLSIICMVTLVVVVIHIINGERDGFQKLFRWLIVSGVGLLLMEVVRVTV